MGVNPLNGRLYSFTVSFDGDRREIDPNNIFIVVSENALQSPMTVPAVMYLSPYIKFTIARTFYSQ